jgi:MacB-like periplasmic core domain
VLSYSVWTNRFGSDRHIVDRAITLNGLAFTVIGVTPPGFKGTFSLAGPDHVWIPLGMRDQLLTGQVKALSTNRRFRWLSIVGRLKPGSDLVQARSAMKVIASSLEKQCPEANQGRTVELASVSQSALGINNQPQFLRAGGVMMSMVGLVLLIACVNMANLLLAQSARRAAEGPDRCVHQLARLGGPPTGIRSRLRRLCGCQRTRIDTVACSNSSRSRTPRPCRAAIRVHLVVFASGPRLAWLGSVQFSFSGQQPQMSSGEALGRVPT